MTHSFALAPATLGLLAASILATGCTTPPPAAAQAGVTVYAAGDIADCRKVSVEKSGAGATAAILVPLLLQDATARVLTLGDNAYQKGTLAEFNDCYGPSWGQFKQRTHPSPGNHEYQTPGASGYYDYFGDAAGPQRRGYYRMQIGDWQVYSLNSYLQPAEHALQLAWLKQELSSANAKCTLAYWHHPMYSSGPHGNSARMRDVWELLQAAKADLVLAGHDHHYERFAAQDANGTADAARGIAQFVVGSGGSTLYPLKPLRPNSVASQDKELGVLKLTLKADRFDWQFLAVAGGSYADSGSQACL